MKPIGRKVLIKQDTKEIEQEIQSKSGIILEINKEDISKQIIEDQTSHVTHEGMDSFESKVKNLSKTKTQLIKLNSGTIVSIGSELENHRDFSLGDRVEFSSFVEKISPEGEEFVLVNVDSLTTNLSRY